ncbi:MAG: ZIP family metal transporter [Erysipelotrichales bacterium]|nr:ZIP family metal transporter [Erysipelotrichales bacterium]
MNIQISLILSFLAGLGTLLGSFLIFVPKLNKTTYIPLFLSISATIMFSFSFLDLIPESIIYIFSNINTPKSFFLIIIPFLFGVLVIEVLDKIYNEENGLKKIGILSFISLAIHNFPEGIATFISSIVNIKLGISLSIGIMLHNIPEGICIAMPLYHSTKNKRKVLSIALIASLAEPLGAIIAYAFLKDNINNLTISIILLFVAGLMINLSINNIYKKVLNDKKNMIKGIIIGILISIIAILI